MKDAMPRKSDDHNKAETAEKAGPERIAKAGLAPSDADLAEFQLMGHEKIAAVSEAGAAMANQLHTAQFAVVQRMVGRQCQVAPSGRVVAGGVDQGRGLGKAPEAERVLRRPQLRRAAVQTGRVPIPVRRHEPLRRLVEAVGLE